MVCTYVGRNCSPRAINLTCINRVCSTKAEVAEKGRVQTTRLFFFAFAVSTFLPSVNCLKKASISCLRRTFWSYEGGAEPNHNFVGLEKESPKLSRRPFYKPLVNTTESGPKGFGGLSKINIKSLSSLVRPSVRPKIRASVCLSWESPGHGSFWPVSLAKPSFGENWAVTLLLLPRACMCMLKKDDSPLLARSLTRACVCAHSESVEPWKTLRA